MKAMADEHRELMIKVVNGSRQLRLCQKEHFHESLKDRELDPWTQSRLDSIKKKHDKIKCDLGVLLQLTNRTIHDKSLTVDDDDYDDDAENQFVAMDLSSRSCLPSLRCALETFYPN